LEKDFETVGYVLNPENNLRTSLEVIPNEKKKLKLRIEFVSKS